VSEHPEFVHPSAGPDVVSRFLYAILQRLDAIVRALEASR
jgi:hypothetical protein